MATSQMTVWLENTCSSHFQNNVSKVVVLEQVFYLLLLLLSHVYLHDIPVCVCEYFYAYMHTTLLTCREKSVTAFGNQFFPYSFISVPETELRSLDLLSKSFLPTELTYWPPEDPFLLRLFVSGIYAIHHKNLGGNIQAACMGM